MKLIKTEDAAGHVLCHDITRIIKDVEKGPVFRKGHVVREEDTSRTAIAKGKIKVNQAVMDAIINKEVKKGDVLGTARIADIMAVKKTWELIPLCHPLMIQKCSIEFEIDKDKKEISAIATVKVEGKTGVEMEGIIL